MVSTEYNRDYQYDLAVSEYVDFADRRSEQYETLTQRKKDKAALGDAHDVQRFLTEALCTNSVSTHHYLFFYLFINLFIDLFIYIYLVIYFLIYLLIYLLTYLFIYLFIY